MFIYIGTTTGVMSIRDYYYNNRVVWDLRARMYGIIDYAGSDFDLTLYLCPYSLEEMI